MGSESYKVFVHTEVESLLLKSPVEAFVNHVIKKGHQTITCSPPSVGAKFDLITSLKNSGMTHQPSPSPAHLLVAVETFMRHESQYYTDVKMSREKQKTGYVKRKGAFILHKGEPVVPLRCYDKSKICFRVVNVKLTKKVLDEIRKEMDKAVAQVFGMDFGKKKPEKVWSVS